MLDIIGHQNVPPRIALLSTVVVRRFGQVICIIFIGFGRGWCLTTASFQFRLPRYGSSAFLFFRRKWQHNFRCVWRWGHWRRWWWHRRRQFRIAAHANATEFIVTKIRKLGCAIVFGVGVITILFGVTFLGCDSRFIWRIFILLSTPIRN